MFLGRALVGGSSVGIGRLMSLSGWGRIAPWFWAQDRVFAPLGARSLCLAGRRTVSLCWTRHLCAVGARPVFVCVPGCRCFGREVSLFLGGPPAAMLWFRSAAPALRHAPGPVWVSGERRSHFAGWGAANNCCRFCVRCAFRAKACTLPHRDCWGLVPEEASGEFFNYLID